MRPYYQDEAVTIYHGNALSVLPLVRADVLVTDPPYGVAFSGKTTKHTKSSVGYIGGDDAEIGPLVVGVALSVLKRGLVFPGISRMFAYPEPQDVGCVYCPSGAGIGRWGFTCFHPILYYGQRGQIAPAPTSFSSFETAERNGHPCPKPIGWMRWAVKRVSLPRETVLDPFMGSGTTLRAAKDLGRRAIGIEIEERYCEIAAKRMEQAALPFEPLPAPAEQTELFEVPQ